MVRWCCSVRIQYMCRCRAMRAHTEIMPLFSRWWRSSPLAIAESLYFNSERASEQPGDLSPQPRCSSTPAAKRGPRLDRVIITATQNIEHNCDAVLSFSKDLPGWHFHGVMWKAGADFDETVWKVMFKLSRVPHWLSLYHEVTCSARLTVWTGMASHELGFATGSLQIIFYGVGVWLFFVHSLQNRGWCRWKSRGPFFWGKKNNNKKHLFVTIH